MARQRNRSNAKKAKGVVVRTESGQRVTIAKPMPASKRRRHRGGGGSIAGIVAQSQRNVRASTGRLGLSSGNRSSMTRRSVVIEEDEYIGEINGSTGFATTQYPVNPGQSGTFPWANKIASLYEKYRFTRLEFYYRREVSEYATNGQTGKVLLSLDFDASDAAPTTKQQVEDTVPHIDFMPCEARDAQTTLRVPCNEFLRTDGLYVRPGAQPANTDIKTYDCANLYVSTYGCANTNVVGELRVRYRCILEVPVLESAGSSPGGSGSYFEVTSALAGEAAATSTNNANLFISTTNPLILANGIGASLATTGIVTVPAGVYLVEAENLAWDAAANVSACTATLDNASPLVVAASTGLPAFTTQNASKTIMWNTAVYGTAISVNISNTYASGSCFNNGHLKITQL